LSLLLRAPVWRARHGVKKARRSIMERRAFLALAQKL